MKNRKYAFSHEHLQNIEDKFEEKSGVQLGKRKNKITFSKLVAVTAAIVLCLSVGTPVMAAYVPPVYEIMYRISPSAAQFFKPVQKSDESNGIQMEVISAYVHGDTAKIYIFMRDLTSDRIDGTTDLFDSYSINRPFDCSATCQQVGYDEAAKTATFLISITQWETQDITGDKITFSVKEFLSHKRSCEDTQIPIELSATGTADSTQWIQPNGGGGREYSFGMDESIQVLTPSERLGAFPVDGIDLSGIGYVDGKLHIQTSVSEYLRNDNHGFFFLKDRDGGRIESSYNVYFANRYDNTPGRIDYCEYVFDVPIEEIGQYTLWGDFVTSGMRTVGNWSVTFPLEKAE